ncbi:MAG: hypothetical protein A2Z38_07735 [Planctomycetes bacterium RBG_19FT_COMBO_48_8]|nr:MAG: hypothetical protein A2Z38_07735 [Planctomycetes bacterium RBG_19FT_COMBO_48_8]
MKIYNKLASKKAAKERINQMLQKLGSRLVLCTSQKFNLSTSDKENPAVFNVIICKRTINGHTCLAQSVQLQAAVTVGVCLTPIPGL